MRPWQAGINDSVAYRGQPPGSIPVTGTLVPAYRVSYQALPATIDSMSALPNPVPPDDRSLANGRKYFQINCAVCHGEKGAGDGPTTRYGFPSINLLTPVTQNRTDGYIFGMIRNGRGLMPTYNRIEEMDRWEVVNYVRGLQGKLGRPVETGPVGQPGETGATVPGYTRTAPTRPAPFYDPTRGARGAVPADSLRGSP